MALQMGMREGAHCDHHELESINVIIIIITVVIIIISIIIRGAHCDDI